MPLASASYVATGFKSKKPGKKGQMTENKEGEGNE
jgi:hypothetical protein